MALALVIVCLSCLIIYHGYYKEYLYEDEVLSYTIANSTKGGFMELEDGRFYSGDDLYAYTYVEKGQEFNYAATITNHKVDAHPPLYGLLLHTVCSVWSGSFSKWSGIGLNLVLFAVLLILVYLTTHELFPERPYFPSFVCLALGITTGVIFHTVFIRMYMLLMVFTTACMFWHIRSIRRKITFPACAALCVLTFAGAMTHYFYLIFAFFCAFVLLVYKIKEKTFKDIVNYVLSMAAAGVLILLSWHDVIYNLFTLDAASDLASQKFEVKQILHKIIQMVRNINGDLFGNRLKYLIIIVLAFAVFLAVKEKEALRRTLHIRAEYVLIIFVSISYFTVVSAITPYLASRYVSPVFPYVVLVTVLTLEQISNEIMVYPVLGYVIIFLFFALPEINVLREGLIDVNRQIIDESSTEQKDCLCLFPDGTVPEENVFELRKFKNIYIYDGRNADGAKEEISKAHKVVVYVPEGAEPEDYAADIRKVNPGLVNMDRLYVAYYSSAYLLSE